MKVFRKAGAAAILMCLAAPAFAALKVQLLSPWDGKKIPAGQHCRLQGGQGGTPPMQVSGIPAGTVWILGSFNDRDYAPLSKNGGHGIIAWPAKGETTELKPVPGKMNKLPNGAKVVKAARTSGEFASPGYLPPCSGGRNNRYSVDISAIDANGKVLAKQTKISIGRY